MSKILSITALTLAMFIAAGSVSAQTLKEKDAKARTQYKAAQQAYQTAVNGYKNAQQDFKTAKDKYQKSKNIQDKSVLEEKSKKFLQNAVDAMIKHLEALKNKVTNMSGIDDADRTSIIAEIDTDLNWLKDRQSKIETATSAQIKEEVKTVKEYWKNIRLTVKKVTGRLLAARINTVIIKADSVSTQVSAKITELKAAGKDVSKLEAWLTDYNAKVALAKEKYEAAKVKFNAIKGEPGPDFVAELKEADKLFKEGHQFVKEANKYIKDAYVVLKQIIKEMRSMGQNVLTDPGSLPDNQ